VVERRLSLRRSIRLRHSMSRRFDSRVSKKVSGFDPISFRTHDGGSYVVSSDVEFDTVTAKNDSDTFEFYHAKSREQRYQGLSGQNSLESDGMLFEYPREEKHRLVFRDMHFPLDVLFLDGDGNIVENGQLDEDNSSTESVCLYALEVEKGWIEQNNVSLTDSFDFRFTNLEKQIPDKYLEGTGLSESDFVPNTDVNDVVEDVLEFIDEHGLPNPDAQREGSTRANQIHDHYTDDEPLEYEYWEEIYNFHQRHRAQGNHECDESSIAESDKEAINQNEHDVCFFDNGYFSDHTWGSDAGYEQAERIVTAVEDADVEKQWRPYEGPQGGFGWTDGEDIVYDDEPPGEVDVSELSDEQVEQLEDELGQSFSDDSSDASQQEIFERDIEDSIDMDNLESTQMLSKDDVVNTLSSDMTRVKQSELADNTISEIESISSTQVVSSWQGSSGIMRLSSNAYERTVSHESAHALVNANGFDTSMFATLVSNAFDSDTGFDDTIIGKSKGEVIDEAESDGNINPNLAEQFRDVISVDDTVEVSDLTFFEMDDFDGERNEELSSLVDSISETFEELINEMKYEEDPIESLTQDRPDTIKNEYEWTNANEFFAAIHENLQQEGIDRNNLEIMYEQYPDVLASYFDVFEPNDLQKRELNQLFNDSGGSGPIESLPFPEVDND